MTDHIESKDYYGEDVTDKFKNMIMAFESDFTLAVDISTLDKIIKDKKDPRHERVIKDIKLLEELSFLLRNDKAIIILKD